MSKMKELDRNSTRYCGRHMKELMYDSIDWQIADQPLDGDDYRAVHELRNR